MVITDPDSLLTDARSQSWASDKMLELAFLGLGSFLLLVAIALAAL